MNDDDKQTIRLIVREECERILRIYLDAKTLATAAERGLSLVRAREKTNLIPKSAKGPTGVAAHCRDMATKGSSLKAGARCKNSVQTGGLTAGRDRPTKVTR